MTAPVLSIRMNPRERDLVASAAERARTTVSDFVRRKALEAAEADAAMHASVTIPAEAWERFEAWAASPPRENARLQRLAARAPAWQD